MADSVLEVDGGHLAWDEAGEGPPLVLAHGFSFSRAMWEPQMPLLAQHFRVIRYDLRGFGASSRPDGPYDHVDDLAAIVAATCDGKVPLLAGLSLGANVVLEHAVRRRGAARGLALAAPGLPGHVWTIPRPTTVVHALAREQGIDAARDAWAYHPIYATLNARPKAGAALVTMVQAYDGWHWMHDDPRLSSDGDLTGALPDLAVPALILTGEEDGAGYREMAERLARELPDARIVRFPGCGHLLNMEAPEDFSRAIVDFAASLA